MRHDPIEEFEVEVHIMRNADSVVRVHKCKQWVWDSYPPDPPSWSDFWWSDGNGSCDCNRKTFFDGEYGPNNLCTGAVSAYTILKIVRVDNGAVLYTEEAPSHGT